MAKTVDVNQSIYSIQNHVESIDNEKLSEILNKVSLFVSNYKAKIKADKINDSIINEQFKTIKQSNDYLSKTKDNIEISKNALNSISSNAKSQLENSDHQLKMQKAYSQLYEKYSEENLKAQEKLMKIQAEERDDNKKLLNVSESLEKYERNNEKIQRKSQKLQDRDRVLQKIANKEMFKFFDLQSEYYRNASEKINYITKTIKEFKENPNGFILEKMGIVLGKALDKSIDSLKYVIKSGLDAVSRGMSDLSSSIFDMISDQKRQAESISKNLNRGYTGSSKALSRANLAANELSVLGELDLSRTSQHIESIAERMYRDYGSRLEDYSSFSQENYKKMFKLYAQAENVGIGSQIEELRKIYGENDSEFAKALESLIQIEGIRSRQDLKVASAMESASISLSDFHKFGMTIEEGIAESRRDQIFAGKIAASNKELLVSEIEAITQLKHTLMSQDFVTNILDNKNVDLSQLIGIDSNTVKSMLRGSDEERLEVINRIIQSGAYNTIPALKELMENLGFDPQALNILQKKGGVRIDQESIKRLEEASKTSYVNLNETMLSSGSLINEQIRNRLSLLSTEGLFDKQGNVIDRGRLSELKRLNTLETLSRDDIIEQFGYDMNSINNIYNLVQEYLNGNEEAINQIESLSKNDRYLAEKILQSSESSEKTMEDQTKVIRVLSDAQDLGLGKAMSGGGLSGLFSGLLDVGLKSAYSPEYQDKITSFMDNIKKAIEPAVRIFKQMLIDPIIDVLSDKIALLLGEILDKLKFWKDDNRSDESSFLSQNRFRSRTLYDEKTGAESSVDWTTFMAKKMITSRERGSENFRKAIDDLMSTENADFKTIDTLSKKYKLDNDQIDQMKAFTALKNTSGIGGLLNSSTSKVFAEQRKNMSSQNSDNAFKTTLNALSSISNSENGQVDLKSFLLSQGLLSEDEISLFEKHRNGLSDVMLRSKSAISKQLNIDQNNFDAAIDSVAFELTKNPNLRVFIYRGGKKQNGELTAISFNNLKSQDGLSQIFESVAGNYGHFYDNEIKYADGGVIEGTKKGKRVIAGENNKDEIIIPTDPNKTAQAQKLLQIAKDKYNVFLKDPNNISDNLSKWIKELVFSTKILMLQLDPLRDVVETGLAKQTFNILRMIGLQKMKTSILNNGNNFDVTEESGGVDDIPMTVSPVKNLEGLSQLRTKIMEAAYSYKGKPYGELPSGTPYPPKAFVCNQLINRAYSDVLGSNSYAELLPEGLNQIHTISGSIGYFDKLEGSVVGKNISYSTAASLAKPGDIVFIGSNQKYVKKGNPLGHTHVGLFVDKDKIYDAAGYGDRTVNFHNPPKKNVTLVNILDTKPIDWYVKNGFVSSDYNPAIQSIPYSSAVEENMSRINNADVEKEKIKQEQNSKKIGTIIKEVVNSLSKIGLTNTERKQIMSMSIPAESGFCTVPNYTRNVSSFETQRRY